MKFINPLKDIFIGKVKARILPEDLFGSRYFPLYNHHVKHFKDHIETLTLNKANDLINKLFSYRITKELKKKIVDCVVIFLKFISINNNNYPGDNKYNSEFNRIVGTYLEKLSNN